MKIFKNKSFKTIALSLLMILLLVMGAACGKSADKKDDSAKQVAKNDTSETILVSAAASLTEPLNEIIKLFPDKNIKIDVQYGGSGALAKQIANGAQVNLFISANQKSMDDIEDKLVKGTRGNLLENELVAIVPKDSDIKSIEDAIGVETAAIGALDAVPAGDYTKEVLKKMNLWEAAEKNATFAKDVKQILSYVESGSAGIGFVYKTDVYQNDKVKVIETFPADSHSPIEYPMAVVKDSAGTKSFVEFLKGEEATKVFEKYGFIIPEQK